MATNMSEALDVVGPENLRLACQQMAETIPGDPLSGTYLSPVTMPNGYRYALQELVFVFF